MSHCRTTEDGSRICLQSCDLFSRKEVESALQGVDYAIYIYSAMSGYVQAGDTLREAYYKAMRLTGKAVIFIGMTLGAGVATWIFASLKFQEDMGILLTFLFLTNMLGAILILPALARWLVPAAAQAKRG